jgi:hypothetical protein
MGALVSFLGVSTHTHLSSYIVKGELKSKYPSGKLGVCAPAGYLLASASVLHVI